MAISSNTNNPSVNVPLNDGEPQENDKCITGNNGSGDVDGNNQSADHNDSVNNKEKPIKSKRMEEFEERMQRAKDIISDRYPRIIIILAIVILILLITVIVLAAVLASESTHDPEVRCESTHCLRAASKIVHSVGNETSQPCDDFWSYACKGWIKHHPIPENRGSFSVKDQMQTQILHDIRHYIDLVPQGIDDRTPEWKVQKFYSSCMNVDEIEYTSTSVLKQDINDIGGWVLLNNFAEQRWDKNKVIERLLIRFGVSPLFKISVDVDDYAPGASIIKIEPDNLGLPNREYYYDPKYGKQVSAYKQFMRETAKELGANLFDANKFAEDMYSYEKRIAEISPKASEWQKPLEMYRKLRVRDLQIRAPNIKWLELLQAYFQQSNVRENTYVLVGFEHYFGNISYIMTTTDNKALNNYLMWRLTSSYIPYLSKRYRAIGNEFVRAMNGVEGDGFQMEENRWEYCIRLTSKFLDLGVGSMFVNNQLQAIQAEIVDANRVVASITDTLLNNVGSIPWVGDVEKAKEKIQTIASMTTIGFPEIVLKKELLLQYYNELIVQNQLYNNIINGVTFQRKKDESRLKEPQSALSNWSPLSPQDIDALYHHAGSRLMIAAGLLRFPIYDPNLPVALKFGAFGFRVGSELLKAFGLKGVLYSSRGELDLALADNERMNPNEPLNKSSSCLLADLDEDSRLEQDITINPDLVLDQTLVDIGALKFVYKAYHSYVSKHGQESSLPGLDRNNDQLFFLSYAQSMCEAVRRGKEVAQYNLMTVLPSRIRVKKTLEHLPEFAQAFKCKASSNSCRLW